MADTFGPRISGSGRSFSDTLARDLDLEPPFDLPELEPPLRVDDDAFAEMLFVDLRPADEFSDDEPRLEERLDPELFAGELRFDLLPRLFAEEPSPA